MILLHHRLVELLHELPEYNRVHVLAELVEYEPVAEPHSPADVLHLHLLDQPGPGLHDAESQPGDHKQGQSVHREETGDEGKEDEPEPEEDVDLLVDDVEREDTETVFCLHRSRRTEFIECTLCDLEILFSPFWKDGSHGIISVL